MTATVTLRYQKQWRMERSRGLTRTTPAAPVRGHLQELLGGHASLRGIADISGIPISVVARIANGGQSTVTNRVAAATRKSYRHAVMRVSAPTTDCQWSPE